MKTLRKTVSVLLLFSFFVTVFSTTGLELRPSKLDPAHASFIFLGVTIASLKLMHSIFGYGMLGLSLFHLLINYKPILNYIRKNKNGVVPSKTIVFATVLVSFLLAFTIVTSTYDDQNNKLKVAQNYAEQSIVSQTEIIK